MIFFALILRCLAALMSSANFNALAGAPLTRGRVVADGTSLNAATTTTVDVYCGGDSTLVVEVDMNGAANGDLTVEVWPFEADNATVMPLPMPAVRTAGPLFSGGKVYFNGEFDVSALEKVQVRVRNTTAGALTVNRASYRLS